MAMMRTFEVMSYKLNADRNVFKPLPGNIIIIIIIKFMCFAAANKQTAITEQKTGRLYHTHTHPQYGYIWLPLV
jgi:hypothetical protein